MPTIERLVTRRNANEEPEEHSTTDTNTGQPTNDLNVSELLRPCGDGRENVGEPCLEETGRNDSSREKRSLLGNFQRRAFNRISFRGESGPLLTRYRQTRFSSRRVRKRVVFKHGDCNVVQGNVAKRRRRYLQVIFSFFF